MVLERPVSYPAALFYPCRVYEFSHKVPPQRAPEWAVLGRVDGAFPHAEYESDRRVSGPAGKLWTALDESLMNEFGACDDYECALAHLHGEDWTIFFS